MNGSFLLLSAAVALGGDPLPVVVSGAGCSGCGSPVVAWAAPVSTCDPCAPRVGLLDRLRAKLAARPRLFANNACAPACAPAPVVSCAPAPVVSCAPAPVSCGQPVFTGFTTSCSDPCERVGLLARLRAKFAGGRSCDASAAPLASACCGSSVAALPAAGLPAVGCTSSFGTVMTAPAAGSPVVSPPDKMPAPMPMTDPKKDEPKKEEPKKEEPKKEEPKKELNIQLPPLSVPSVDVPRVPSLGGTTGKY